MQSPIYRVVSLWVRSGAVAEFEAYERKAARIMKKYGGSIEKVIRTGQEDSPDILKTVVVPGVGGPSYSP